MARMTKDEKLDKKLGVKPGSKRDLKLDKKRGVKREKKGK